MKGPGFGTGLSRAVGQSDNGAADMGLGWRSLGEPR